MPRKKKRHITDNKSLFDFFIFLENLFKHISQFHSHNEKDRGGI